jgi:imidazolonepropionase-like amidohydrolase
MRAPASPRNGTALALAAVVAAAALPHPTAAQLAVRGEVVYPVAGPAIQDGVVLVGADGRIQAVGPASEVQIPAGYRTLSGAVVTPGLVDARSVVGLAGYLNQPHDQDQMDLSSAVQPELRALDAYNAREVLVGWLRNHGITTVHTGHAPGPLVSGQTMIVKTRGENVGEAVVQPVTMVAMTLGSEATQIASAPPGSRPNAVAMLRQELVRAREYAERRAGSDPPARNLRLETLAGILAGEIRVLLTAHRTTDIMTALRLRREFGLDMVLDGAAEAHLLVHEIREAGVPVILHPPLARYGGPLEHGTFESARILRDAGIPVTIQSGYEPYVPKTRVVLFEAAPLLGHGLSFDETLALVTLDAARILRIDDRVGSLEVGKDGDVAIFDGDPFEYVSRVCGVVIDGRVVSEECH